MITKRNTEHELYRVSIGSRGKTDKNKNDLTAYVIILKPKVRFTMEMIVFGSFLVLSLVAFACQQAAKATDQQKKSVSNANFIKFQRSFFLVYFLALFGDWLQGPYVYRLYNYYGYQEDQIATLYVAGFASRYCTIPGVPTSFRQEFSKKIAKCYEKRKKKLVKVCLHSS